MKAAGFIFSAISLVVFGALGFDIGSLTSKGEPFIYDSADKASQERYLSSVAKPMEREIRRALSNPSGVGPRIYLTGTSVNTDARSIRFDIMITSGNVRPSSLNGFKQENLSRMCAEYVGSELSDNGLMIIQNMVDSDKQSLTRIVVSNHACSQIS